MQFAEVSGGRLAYDENGSGPDILFVHGIPTDYRAWNAQVPVFSQKYHVITYSRRHAKPNSNTGSLRESTIDNNAVDLQELIQKTTSPPINLIGHSYGGFIAAHVAANHPKLVRRLVLIEPGITTLLIRDPQSRAQNAVSPDPRTVNRLGRRDLHQAILQSPPASLPQRRL